MERKGEKKNEREKENSRKYRARKITTKGDLLMYCQLLKENVKRISEDEVLTVNMYEHFIKKFKLKKVKVFKVPSDSSSHMSSSSSYFYDNYYIRQEPVLIKNLGNKIGKCVENFNAKNLIDSIGNTKVSIHVSNSKFLNNINKNFRYQLAYIKDFIYLISKEKQKKNKFSIREKYGRIYIQFTKDCSKNFTKKEKGKKYEEETNVTVDGGDFRKKEKCKELFQIDEKRHHKKCYNDKETLLDIESNKHCQQPKSEDRTESHNYYYYRSLGKNPFKDVSDIKQMNKWLKENFYLPQAIYPSIVDFDFFSSVLRISQNNIFLWLHYDIPDNFLIQIKGRKKILLIPPQFIKYFNITGSSSAYNLFSILTEKNLMEKEKTIRKILRKHSIVADLMEGDILFIPSLWLHYIYNMPEHTYVSKKFKHLQKYISIERDQEAQEPQKEDETHKNSKYDNAFEDTELSEKTINTSLSRLYRNIKFLKAMKRKRNKHSFLIKISEKSIPVKRFLTRDATNTNETEMKKKNHNCTKSIQRKQEKNKTEINKADITEEELIVHYSHMEHYEKILKEKFNIIVPAAVSKSSNAINASEQKKNQENSEDIENAIEHANEYHTKKNDICSLDDSVSETKLNISINFFFRKKNEKVLFSKKDLYGNQDIHVATQVFQKIKKEIEPILKLSDKYKNFYLQKIQGILYDHMNSAYLY